MDDKQNENLLDDNQLLEEVEEAPEDGDDNAAADDADGAGDAGKQDEQVEDERDQKIRALEAENKTARDKTANVKGKAETFRRLLKKMKDDGLLDEADLAVDGVDAKEVAVWIEKGVDKDAVDEKLQYFDRQVSGAKAYFDEKYGDVNELIQNYSILLRDDPDERARLDATPDAVVVDYILRRGQEIGEEISDLKTAGGRSLPVIRGLKKQTSDLEKRIAELEAENASLKGDAGEGQQPAVVHKPKTSVNAPAVATRRAGSFYADL
jgi:hypothetical protein